MKWHYFKTGKEIEEMAPKLIFGYLPVILMFITLMFYYKV